MKLLVRVSAVVFLAASLMAQTPARGGITASSTDCSIGAACVVAQLSQANGGAIITVSGTFSATVQFEAQGSDGSGGAVWNSIACSELASPSTLDTSATSAGAWQCNIAGALAVRVRSSAYTSGTVNVSIVPSTASARLGGGGGGGGGTPGGSNTQLQYNASGSFGGAAQYTYSGGTLTAGSSSVTDFSTSGATVKGNTTTNAMQNFYGGADITVLHKRGGVTTIASASNTDASRGTALNSLCGSSGSLVEGDIVVLQPETYAMATDGSQFCDLSLTKTLNNVTLYMNGATITGANGTGGRGLVDVALGVTRIIGPGTITCNVTAPTFCAPILNNAGVANGGYYAFDTLYVDGLTINGQADGLLLGSKGTATSNVYISNTTCNANYDCSAITANTGSYVFNVHYSNTVTNITTDASLAYGRCWNITTSGSGAINYYLDGRNVCTVVDANTKTVYAAYASGSNAKMYLSPLSVIDTSAASNSPLDIYSIGSATITVGNEAVYNTAKTGTGTGGTIAYSYVNLFGAAPSGVTGTGNVVLSASPTFTGTVGAANITATGTITSGSGSGVGGIFGCAQGTAPSLIANGFSIFCDTSIGTGFAYKAPNAESSSASILAIGAASSHVNTITPIAEPNDASKFLDGTGAFSRPLLGMFGVSSQGSAAANSTFYSGAHTIGLQSTAANVVSFVVPQAMTLVKVQYCISVTGTLDTGANNITLTVGTGGNGASYSAAMTDTALTLTAQANATCTALTTVSDAVSSGQALIVKVATPASYSTTPSNMAFSARLWFQ